MFNAIYRLRLLVQETHQSFSIHICSTSKEKEPTFHDLIKKVEHVTEKKLDLRKFYLATIDNNVALYDDQSLYTALKNSISADQPLEIALWPRHCSSSSSISSSCNNKKPLDDLRLRNNNTNQQHKPTTTKAPVRTSKVPTIIHLQPINTSSSVLSAPPATMLPSFSPASASEENNVPVIKPTVLRWTTPDILPSSSLSSFNAHTDTDVSSNVRRYSSISQDDHHQIIDGRKDSGISLDDDDEPHYRKKKQRVMSADHPRKLPDLSSPSGSSSPMLLPSIRCTTSLHPLEIKRPSTAPPSCSPPNSPFPKPQRHHGYVLPTLPAISSITSPTHHHHSQILDPQLAPIHSLMTAAAKPPSHLLFYQQQHHLHATTFLSHQHHHHHITASSAVTSDTTTTHNKQQHNNKRHRSSGSSSSVAAAATASSATTNSNLFLCEHKSDNDGKVCGQTFKRSYDLSRHQTIHLENRPFCYCNQCGKKFTRMDALRRHERVQGHTGLAAAAATATKHRSMSVVVVANSARLNLPPLGVQQRKTSV